MERPPSAGRMLQLEACSRGDSSEGVRCAEPERAEDAEEREPPPAEATPLTGADRRRQCAELLAIAAAADEAALAMVPEQDAPKQEAPSLSPSTKGSGRRKGRAPEPAAVADVEGWGARRVAGEPVEARRGVRRGASGEPQPGALTCVVCTCLRCKLAYMQACCILNRAGVKAQCVAAAGGDDTDEDGAQKARERLDRGTGGRRRGRSEAKEDVVVLGGAGGGQNDGASAGAVKLKLRVKQRR